MKKTRGILLSKTVLSTFLAILLINYLGSGMSSTYPEDILAANSSLALTTTPTITFSTSLSVSLDIQLISSTFDESTGDATFTWYSAEPLAPEFGFEIRVDNTQNPSLGIHNAILNNQNGAIEELGNNTYRFSGNVGQAPGVAGRSADNLYWTVAVSQISPEYQPPQIQVSPIPIVPYNDDPGDYFDRLIITSTPTIIKVPLPDIQLIINTLDESTRDATFPATLEQPLSDIQLISSIYDESTGDATFTWYSAEPLGPEFGFEIRVDNIQNPSLGIHNAILDNQNGAIEELGNNIYRFNGNVGQAPGVAGRSADDLYWTIAVPQISPGYQPPQIQATSNPINLVVATPKIVTPIIIPSTPSSLMLTPDSLESIATPTGTPIPVSGNP